NGNRYVIRRLQNKMRSKKQQQSKCQTIKHTQQNLFPQSSPCRTTQRIIGETLNDNRRGLHTNITRHSGNKRCEEKQNRVLIQSPVKLTGNIYRHKTPNQSKQ